MSAIETRKIPMLSAEMRDAAIAEVLGDVHHLHKSVKDLAHIVADTDQRVTSRVIELRQISEELASQRESAFAAISTRARESAQKAFKDDIGRTLQQFNTQIADVPRAIVSAGHRRFAELLTVGVACGALSCLGTLVGMWMIQH